MFKHPKEMFFDFGFILKLYFENFLFERNKMKSSFFFFLYV